jgi:N-acetylglucosaminyl-diphospho-decaprenol L-rhamnosyltransferase
MLPAVDIIIVNWKSSSSLQGCLANLVDSARAQHNLTRIVVVDNGSEDNCAEVVSKVPGAVFHQNSSNRGFAVACNIGASESRADFLLFLNPDTHVQPDAIDKVVSVMNRPETAHLGIAGIQLYDESGKQSLCCSRFPTTWSLFLEMTGFDRIARGIFKSRHLTTGELAEDREVDQVIGAFFMIRRDLFERLSGFDERFFVYFEEVDLSLRARQAGYTARFISGAAAIHTGRVSSNQAKARRLFYFLCSRLLYAKKHLGKPSFALICFCSIIVEPAVRICSVALGCSQSSFGQVVSAYREFYVAIVRAARRQRQRHELAREQA